MLPSKNPSKNLVFLENSYRRNPSKKHLFLKNLLRTLLRSVLLHDPLGVRPKQALVWALNKHNPQKPVVSTKMGD